MRYPQAPGSPIAAGRDFGLPVAINGTNNVVERVEQGVRMFVSIGFGSEPPPEEVRRVMGQVMERWVASTLSVALLVTAGACVQSAAGPPAMTVRDSAGVRIVEYHGAPAGSHYVTVSPEPLYRYGDDPGEHEFQRIFLGALRPDGGAVVADVGSQEVVAIGAGGALESVLARSGQGPDEVRGVRSITLIGRDTVLVEDDGNAKLILFVDGALARTVSTGGDGSLSRGLSIVGVDDAGRPLMITGAYRSGFTQPWLSGHMVRLDLNGPRADTVASYDMAASSPPGAENPFPPYGHATGSGGLFVYGRSDVPELSWRGPGGELRQIIRWSPERQFPTRAHWDRFEAYMRETLVRINPQMDPARVPGFIDEQIARYQVRYDVPFPLFMRIHGDDEGGAWLPDYSVEYVGATGFEFPRLHVISPAGEWLGSVEMPPRFRVLDIAHGRVLGVLRDEMDVESVAVFEVHMEPLGA